MRIRTLFLQLCLIVAVLIDLALAIFAFWPLTGKMYTIYKNLATALLTGVGLYIIVVAFAFSCFIGWQLLRTIGKQLAFSERAVQLLRRLKWGVGVIVAAMLLMLPQVYVIAQSEDAPGTIFFFGIFMMVPAVITVFLAILQRLWQAALDYKTDSDLTV